MYNKYIFKPTNIYVTVYTCIHTHKLTSAFILITLTIFGMYNCITLSLSLSLSNIQNLNLSHHQRKFVCP